jgi:hypothetical protein
MHLQVKWKSPISEEGKNNTLHATLLWVLHLVGRPFHRE